MKLDLEFYSGTSIQSVNKTNIPKEGTKGSCYIEGNKLIINWENNESTIINADSNDFVEFEINPREAMLYSDVKNRRDCLQGQAVVLSNNVIYFGYSDGLPARGFHYKSRGPISIDNEESFDRIIKVIEND